MGNEGVNLGRPWARLKVRSAASEDSLVGSSSEERPKGWVCLREGKGPSPSLATQGGQGLNCINGSSAFLYLPKGE